MTEAKDTVMSDEEIREFMLKLYNNPILLVKLASALNNIFREEGKHEGRKEVVEWLMSHAVAKQYRLSIYYTITKDEIITKLKEWGLSEEE